MNTWYQYAQNALKKKCYNAAHEFTYPLISLQTELAELNDALRKLADRMKHATLASELSKPLLDAAKDELSDVLWAYSALCWAVNPQMDLEKTPSPLFEFWHTDFRDLENDARLSATTLPCKFKTAVPAIYTQLNPIADYICKLLRNGAEEVIPFPNKLVNEKLLSIGQALVKITMVLGDHLTLAMYRQLNKMDEREVEGKFVVLTSTQPT
jgi:hypothetical protein